MNSRQRTLGHAAALMTILIWGTTFVSTKVLLRDFTPVTVLFTRFVIGYAFLWCLKPRFLPFSGWKKEFLFAGAGLTRVTLYFLLENIALTHTFASNVGIIVAVVPFFTALLAHFLLKGKAFPAVSSWVCRRLYGYLPHHGKRSLRSEPNPAGISWHWARPLSGLRIPF